MPVARGFDVLRAALAAPLHGRPSAARERLRQEAAELVRDEELVEAAYSYRIVPLEAPAASLLRAGGEQLQAPRLIPESGQLTALACGACTLGSRLEARVGALFAQRRASLALALDALGNEMLFAASRRAQDRMLADAGRRGLTMAGELRAGDPGLALEAQAAVLRLAWAETIGIHIPHGQLMQPLKSASMVLGVGIDLPPAHWSRCDACNFRQKCGRSGASAIQPGPS
ncbi:vitamin B12 dependent methionine synthase, activation domain [mine drainage metagenome]|uniref:Vitamin B12 dependent methionine synthase, activation domain n=1 Tax=mine drainage metagenome TaxID=410659 RepID=A0A1J5S0V9_9ZZZZ